MSKNFDCKAWAEGFFRVVIAAIFLYHGIPKLLNISGTTGFFGSLGLPGFVGILVGVVEVVAPILILLGIWYKYANYSLAVVMAGALILTKISNGISSGLERDLLLFAGTLLLAAIGPGKWTLAKK